MQLNAQKSLAVVKMKIELDSNADTSIISFQYLVVHDHNRPINVYRYDPKVGSMHAYVVDAMVAHDEPETDC